MPVSSFLRPFSVCVFFLTVYAAAHAENSPVTFHKDIEPLLQDRCQTCHHPGDIAPMSLLTYKDARQWAKAIKEYVSLGKMPPWYADPSAHQHYQNDKTLSSAEIQQIRAWVDAGAPEGDPKDAPLPRNFPDGWNIGKPDLIVPMPKPYQIPAQGTIAYTYVIIPTHFKHDMWVQAAEIRPSSRSTMHHSILFLRTPGSKWLAGYPKNQAFVPKPRPGTDGRSSEGDRTEEGSLADEWLASYVPGQRPWIVPPDTGFLVKAGSDFVLQIHYTANGKPTEDLTRIGLVFCQGVPAKRAYTATLGRGDFAIPPGDPNYQTDAAVTLATPVTLLSASPHMHLRGKAMTLNAVYPNGSSETLFSVPHYSFNWQQMYVFETPKLLPVGTRLEATAAWDNSTNNPFNPDPKVEVHWGDQSWEEMMLSVMIFQIDRHTDLDHIYAPDEKRASN